MKKGLLVLTALTFSVALVFSVVFATDAPENITMDNPVFAKHKKALVTLSHKKHAAEYKVACTDCHHVIKEGKNVWKEGDAVQKCTECHKEAKAPSGKDAPKLSKAEKIKDFYYDAIHENCVGCHKAEKKKGKNAPSTCKDCHPGKE